MNMEAPYIEIEPGRADAELKADVLRCLTMLYSAHPGEQALDRDFGIDASALSKPITTAQALMAAEFVAKTARYEPRVRVKRVEWREGDAEEGLVKPKVVVEIVND
ncbi:GPW/gp25 family protein [uncultured Subdoligranulum sp.]|uniref:GPW/gp25 family protein n=1 Tax=uncultured Subdoligranulum sp. TaxID=512298 RepID=UPI0025E1FEF2|nr:GPW/gp25 family protein [uncultured Subdoligranulum sp.]